MKMESLQGGMFTAETPEDVGPSSYEGTTDVVTPKDNNSSLDTGLSDPNSPYIDVPSLPTVSCGEVKLIVLKDTVESEEQKDKAENLTNPLEFHYKLQQTLQKDLTAQDGRGHIYVITDPKRPELRKIGMTEDPIGRKNKIQLRCGIEVDFVHCTKVNYQQRAEALIHAELAHLRDSHDCKCRTKHREWFHASDATCIESVNRWAKFVNTNPYNTRSKELHPFWKYLLAEKDPLSTDQNPTVNTLRGKWAEFLIPSYRDHLNYWNQYIQKHPLWSLIWEFFWQVNAVLAWTMLFMICQSALTFAAMLWCGLGALSSMSHSFSSFQRSGSYAKSPRRKTTKFPVVGTSP
jgi:hypothetical protein